MAYRNLGDVENRILNATIKYGAEHGVSNVSTKQLTKYCDASDFTIFSRFKTKQGLLDAAALKIENEIIKFSIDACEKTTSLYDLWDVTLEHLLSIPDVTIYYFEYINTFGFDPTEENKRAPIFEEAARIFFKESSLPTHQLLMVWDYVTSMLFYYGEKIIHNFIPKNDENLEFIKKIVFNGINQLINN